MEDAGMELDFDIPRRQQIRIWLVHVRVCVCVHVCVCVRVWGCGSQSNTSHTLSPPPTPQSMDHPPTSGPVMSALLSSCLAAQVLQGRQVTYPSRREHCITSIYMTVHPHMYTNAL